MPICSCWMCWDVMGCERFYVDYEIDRLYQHYLKDRSTVPPDIRQIFDAISRRTYPPKPKDDEAFRFFLEDDVSF